ncbi:hypothetical protein B0H14DRAFT_2392468 [Mycena olivaceomarginata]|nr:hypothetical protein B0H14DRAFT_2392468 [Mycena olivaceomarginata]
MRKAISLPLLQSEGTSVIRSEIWYEDGSVVLQAQDTQFRVHWGVLAQQSSFFRDIQDLPQPSNQPSVDGCPIVELQEDDSADVEYLLKVLYSSSVNISTLLTQTALPLAAVRALIRLGRKYDFSELLKSAVGRLQYENPTTLAGFEAIMATRPMKPYEPTRIVHYPGILLDILTLARENELLSVLPCAYFRVISHCNPLFDGVPRGDGTTAFLSAIDQRRCVISRDELVKARFQEGYPLGWLQNWEFDSDCADPAKCNHGRNTRVHYYIKCAPLWILYRSRDDQKVLCPACYGHATASTLAGRKKMWEDLPGLFALPAWSELKKYEL